MNKKLKNTVKYFKRSEICRRCRGMGSYEGYNGFEHQCDSCGGTGKLLNEKEKVIKAYEKTQKLLNKKKKQNGYMCAK